MEMTTIKRTTLGRQILEAIVDMLIRNNYKAGDRIPSEKSMAESLGVAKNSVREALKAMVLADLIEATPGRGTFLRVDASEIAINPNGTLQILEKFSLKELMQVRNMFEVEAAGIAADHRRENPAYFPELDAAWRDNLTCLRNRMNNEESGFRFHRTIVAMADNKLLEKLLDPVWVEVRKAFNLFQVETEEQFQEEERAHSKIYQAIVEGRADDARRFMRQHLGIVNVWFPDLVK